MLAAAAPAAPAATFGQLPFQVRAATLTQDGRLLRWSVELDHPFYPAELEHDGRSLCLLIERPRNASVAGQLCIEPPRRRQLVPRLLYMRITRAGPGPGRAISVTVTRSGRRQLSATFLPTGTGIDYRPMRWQVISTLRAPGCVPAVADPAGCYALFPARPALADLHSPRLVGCVPSGAPFVYHGPSNRRVIALTFDDGPWPDTPRFLDVLERAHAVATFFEIGDQISTYGRGGAIERRMLADGDMVGDHTWNHQDVSAGGSFAGGEISQAANAIRQATGGFTPCLFRAPGGAVSGALISKARSLGFTTIQWDIDPRDWAIPGTDAIYQTVISNAHNGAIVIQHDGGGNRSETLAALPREIHTLRSDGYRFVTITDLLGQQLIYK